MKTAQAFRFLVIAASLSIVVSSYAHAAENNLLLHLNLNEGSGVNATDSSGENNDATLTAEGSWDSSGKVGSAVSLISDTYLTGLRLELTDFTLSTWVKTTTTGRGDLILQYDDAPYPGFGLIINPGFAEFGCGSGNLIGLWVGASTYICTSEAIDNLNDGEWHLITATWDASSQVGKIYFDGTLVAEDTREDANTTNDIESIYFGYNPYGEVGYIGSLDDIRIYGQVLSADQIHNIYSLISPTISLNGSSSIDLIVGDEFTDPLATAEDFEGNSLEIGSSTSPTSVDTSIEETYVITYTTTDNIGLSSSTTRTIIVTEPENTPPTISLNGSETVELTVGDDYIDEGVTISDAEDDQIDLIVSSSTDPVGGVNTSSEETYIITYTVTDTDGASASTTRTVNITAPEPDPEPEPVVEESTPKTQEHSTVTGSRRHSIISYSSVSSGSGQVLGASVSCGKYLNNELHPLQDNDKEDIIKLQALLKETIDPTLPMTGEFGPRTLGALKEFQIKYRKTIIDPWIQKGFITNGQATGVVGLTTLWTINNMVCPNLQLPPPVI